MSSADKRLFDEHPRPWRWVRSYEWPHGSSSKIVDANGDEVIDARWGSGTLRGALVYEAICRWANDEHPSN